MKKILLSFVLFFGANFFAKADTITYFHIFVDDVLVLKTNIIEYPHLITVNADSASIISVKYIKDYICMDCENLISVCSLSNSEKVYSQTKHDNATYDIDIKPLNDFLINNDNNIFIVYYYDNIGNGINVGRCLDVLFYIKLE